MQFAQTGEALGASYRFGERVGSGAVGEVWTVTSADGRTACRQGPAPGAR